MKILSFNIQFFCYISYGTTCKFCLSHATFDFIQTKTAISYALTPRVLFIEIPVSEPQMFYKNKFQEKCYPSEY